ncbi:hypothetical protein SO802_022509 [Lithocarpus litseifolius]|uniref:Uncharacterized protein n=1 Tax=Lithocarpus litseifolius TaxID=425828 RepID=A0AAW2C3K5_9ROSI
MERMFEIEGLRVRVCDEIESRSRDGEENLDEKGMERREERREEGDSERVEVREGRECCVGLNATPDMYKLRLINAAPDLLANAAQQGVLSCAS